MKNSNISRVIWGIILILIAVGLVMNKVGSPVFAFMPEIGLWQILIGLALLAILINSILKISFGGILFSLAFLGIVFQHELKIESLVPWTILLVALLGTIALNLIFGKTVKQYHLHNNHHNKDKHDWNTENIEIDDENHIVENVKFGGATKYIHSDNFEYATFTCNFGGMEVYLDKVTVPSGKATIEIHSRFSGVEIYVPSDWRIENKISTFAGAVDSKNFHNDGNITLTLVGDNQFGAIEIKRI